MTDLDDASNCPVSEWCDMCGAAGAFVTVARCSFGAFCIRFCDRCAGNVTLPLMSWDFVTELCLEHCAHLGIDANRMAGLVYRHGVG